MLNKSNIQNKVYIKCINKFRKKKKKKKKKTIGNEPPPSDYILRFLFKRNSYSRLGFELTPLKEIMIFSFRLEALALLVCLNCIFSVDAPLVSLHFLRSE